ncbi:MAG: hypothetical protein R6W06_04425 [Prochlorococcaceae cyanobacterium]
MTIIKELNFLSGCEALRRYSPGFSQCRGLPGRLRQRLSAEEASIWKLDPRRFDAVSGQAAFTGLDSNGVGNWESSGIIDVSALYGGLPGSFFLANVQAHNLGGGNLHGSGYLVEGGQIVLIEQPAQ